MKYTVQTIFKKFGQKYLEKYNPTYEQKKVYNQILTCRTELQGTRIYKCQECGHKVFSYNSCRDRHCPNCQNYRKEVWIEKHKNEIINTPYFHVVVTVPSELHVVLYHNKSICYKLLFKCASETILELCEDEKYLGAKVGITAMIHTWSQKGNYHPHIHMIVTGGGIDKLGRWKEGNSKYFLPVKVISRKFRGKLLDNLKKVDLKFYNEYEYLNDKKNLNKIIGSLYKKEWVCYSKEPFNNVEETYKYLGRYAYKVCMSNERIVKVDEDRVWFKYKDRMHNNEEKVMKIKGEEFVRKFLLHTLPKSFMKIRYFGILSRKNKNEKIERIKILTKTKRIKEKFLRKLELLNKIVGRDVTRCSKCDGELYLLREIRPKKPPDSRYKGINIIWKA